MVSKKLKSLLEKQQYGFCGEHSAVKVCTWTKKSLTGNGVCYKQKFYGIRSHLCCQMSPTVGFCQNACVFCWRDLSLTEGKNKIEKSDTIEKIDSPEDIIKNSVEQQRKLLSGFGGNEKTDLKKLKESQNPEHYAISLTGEPTLYPKINQLIKMLHEKGKTTFLVSNGLTPEIIKTIEPPTQLYVSIDAPNEELWKKIDRSSVKDGWNKLMETLDILNDLKDKTRTTLRITMIKDMNMVNPEQYADLIKRSDALFVEVKAYMFVGSSRQRLTIKNMPRHNEVREFSEKICEKSGYKIIDEKKESRVILLAKEDFEGRIMKFD